MTKPRPPAEFDENPQWTAEDFAHAVPASQLHPPAVLAALMKPSIVGSIRAGIAHQGMLARQTRLAA